MPQPMDHREEDRLVGEEEGLLLQSLRELQEARGASLGYVPP
jgi:hypothetical protein